MRSVLFVLGLFAHSVVALAADPLVDNIFAGTYVLESVERDCQFKGFTPKDQVVPFPSPLAGVSVSEGRRFTIALAPCESSDCRVLLISAEEDQDFEWPIKAKDSTEQYVLSRDGVSYFRRGKVKVREPNSVFKSSFEADDVWAFRVVSDGSLVLQWGVHHTGIFGKVLKSGRGRCVFQPVKR